MEENKNLQMQDDFTEIPLREIIETVWNGKWFILLVTIVCIVVAGIVGVILANNSKQASTIVSFTYQGIEDGQNPDETKFDINKINSPYVLNNAILKNKLDITSADINDIAKNITILPIVPSDVLKITETAIKQGKEYYYFPTKYKVMLKPLDSMTDLQAQNILNLIIAEYEKYFLDMYSGKVSIGGTLSESELLGYDYVDVSKVITNKINQEIALLEDKNQADPEYRSENTGLSFADLINNLTLLKEIDIEKFNSIVNIDHLTRDKDSLIKIYQNDIKKLTLIRKEKLSEAEEAKEMMELYEKDNNYILVPSNVDGNAREVKANVADSYYDVLAQKAMNASVEATNAMHQIEYYNSEIEMINTKTKIINKEETDAMVDKIVANFLSINKKTEEILEEYYNTQYGKSIKQLIPAEIETNSNLKTTLAIALMLGVMLGAFIEFFKVYWKKKSV